MYIFDIFNNYINDKIVELHKKYNGGERNDIADQYENG